MCAKFEVIDTRKDVDSPQPRKRTRSRETICPKPDYSAAARRPGQRRVAAEKIRRELEEFPG